MTGWLYVLGDCYSCGTPFTFSAERVPSIIVEGVREPICRSCVALVNPMRIANGLPPIVPLPDAYGADPA